ncbi:hypothetical protein [Ideonella sp. B508-1]|uniref:hypothetical protein n=1 Tax=Ideonella sp. B508-1 TaxID=137716 RepID=UPI0003448EE8|nr:hypothetical protein [Ideonella sp. B508-1]
MDHPGFTLCLLDAQQVRRLAGVVRLLAEDAHGQFALWPRHEPQMTVLEPGLFRYRLAADAADADWHCGACAGGLLRSAWEDGVQAVRIVSSRFLVDADAATLLQRLDALLAADQRLRLSTREEHLQLDLALMRRLQQLAQTAPGGRA